MKFSFQELREKKINHENVVDLQTVCMYRREDAWSKRAEHLVESVSEAKEELTQAAGKFLNCACRFSLLFLVSGATEDLRNEFINTARKLKEDSCNSMFWTQERLFVIIIEEIESMVDEIVEQNLSDISSSDDDFLLSSSDDEFL